MNNDYLDTTIVTLGPFEGDTEEVLKRKLYTLNNWHRGKRTSQLFGICLALAAITGALMLAGNPAKVFAMGVLMGFGFTVWFGTMLRGLTIEKSYKSSAEALSSALDLVVKPQLADKS